MIVMNTQSSAPDQCKVLFAFIVVLSLSLPTFLDMSVKAQAACVAKAFQPAAGLRLSLVWRQEGRRHGFGFLTGRRIDRNLHFANSAETSAGEPKRCLADEQLRCASWEPSAGGWGQKILT